MEWWGVFPPRQPHRPAGRPDCRHRGTYGPVPYRSRHAPKCGRRYPASWSSLSTGDAASRLSGVLCPAPGYYEDLQFQDAGRALSVYGRRVVFAGRNGDGTGVQGEVGVTVHVAKRSGPRGRWCVSMTHDERWSRRTTCRECGYIRGRHEKDELVHGCVRTRRNGRGCGGLAVAAITCLGPQGRCGLGLACGAGIQQRPDVFVGLAAAAATGLEPSAMAVRLDAARASTA